MEGNNSCDVLVVGAGIAGVEAAIAAAQSGARVALASLGATFSGSSFFAGTWGLGLVGPRDDADANDLVDAICEVGRGMAVRPLAQTLVQGIPDAMARLEDRGVELQRAERANERDFIPCFDRSHRSWRGLGRDSYRTAAQRELARLGVVLLPECDLLDLVCEGNNDSDSTEDVHAASGTPGTGPNRRVTGAVLWDRRARRMRTVSAGAMVLATGGFGGLFSRTLTMPDVVGTSAAVALEAGARLVNIEFIQIMPGLMEPVKNVVFNERTFKYAQVEGFQHPDAAALLDARSEHGPFSASLADRAVDLALAQAGPRGAAVGYDLPPVLPEFMQTYFAWFEHSFGKSPAEGVRILPYAHASNGGILVNEQAGTGVDGLFACGEASGGMHGADRIGGLASANALVFGEIAGREAAAWAATHPASDPGEKRDSTGGGCPTGNGTAGAGASAAPVQALLADLRRVMGEKCLVERSAQGLAEVERAIDELETRLDAAAANNAADSESALARATSARHALLSARALVAAMAARAESRGAHYRADFPTEDPTQARPNVVELRDDRPRVLPLANAE